MANYSLSYHPLRKTGAFSNLVLEYIEGEPRLCQLFPDCSDLDSIMQRARSQIQRSDEIRRGVADRVKQLYSSILQPNIDPKQLEYVGHANTRFIVTAHQPILLGGPLYVFYKLSSVVALARRLNEHPNKGDLHFIPLYWVGDEDHDLDEIGHCHVLGQKIDWNPRKGGASGRLLIEDAEEFLSPLESALGNRPEAARWMRLARDCYRKGASLLDATVRWTDALFGAAGLVVFSGDDAHLKRMAMRIWEKEVGERFSEPAARRGGDTLIDMGYHRQLSPRAVNLFWLEEGSRTRLVRQEGHEWHAGEHFWANDKAMLQQIHADPGKDKPQCGAQTRISGISPSISGFCGRPGGGGLLASATPRISRGGD